MESRVYTLNQQIHTIGLASRCSHLRRQLNFKHMISDIHIVSFLKQKYYLNSIFKKEWLTGTLSASFDF